MAVSWLLVIGTIVDDRPAEQLTGQPVSEHQHYKWKLVTTWPKNFPGLGTAPERFAE